MNKILLGLIAFGSTSMAFASGVAPAPVNYFDGFYAGVGIGANHTAIDASHSINDVINVPFPSATDSIVKVSDRYSFKSEQVSGLGNIGFGGELVLGYGETFSSNYYLGVELFGRYMPTKMTSTTNDKVTLTALVIPKPIDLNTVDVHTNLEISNDASFGANLKFGYLITPKTMVYLLIGGDTSKYDIKVTDSFTGTVYSYAANNNLTPKSVAVAGNYSYSYDHWRSAFAPGIGLETLFTDNLGLRFQYSYHMYEELNNTTLINSADVNSKAVDSFKPIRGVFMLGLNYHFNGL